ncbi:fatty acid oxidation complex subunit alpha FadB [Solimonas terrae]|uniref:enoyl-CoA hydratase n=1 Tax=Solimonas terrae TaxID=1396819 RepID=A0A6M2BPS1_9GAMM|nr:fatty acid oxidation complex subunit alpha FadB [Solimonas terrae]NGY04354.1 fatty acid oxidation complex subunit alpha FadB [Solimonas terrae]
MKVSYQGNSIRVQAIGEGIAELCFDREGEAINKLDSRTMRQLGEAVAMLAAEPELRGVLICSSKDVFIVGADITEFGENFKLAPRDLCALNLRSNEALLAIEALPVPVVVAINGFALGGGLELALAGDYRVMSDAAMVGLPEVKLGLFPGLGGTVRLPRVASVEVAIDWIAGGAPAKAAAALAAGVVDELATPETLRETALVKLKTAAAAGDWRLRRKAKSAALPQDAASATALFADARAKLARRSAPHQPAALAAVELMEACVAIGGRAAIEKEAEAFVRIARTQAAASLVQIFLNDQLLKKKYKAYARQAAPVKQAAVLGAGIMGGGIAYTSALRGTPVRMKDIQQSQLELGMGEAHKLLAKQVRSGRLKAERADAIAATITPQLDYAGFEQVDAVVEAVVENLDIKHRVLSEIEGLVGADTVIASNTSSLRIDDLAVPLQRPENFVGMHFFNPVPAMPLVEVIRGSRSSVSAVAKIVGYGVAMGKTPIVVKDGPGFLVNRIFTPYMQAFGQLIADGADFVAIDAAMEKFGWPMGPAYLNDVIGMDTAIHVSQIIAAGHPQHMRTSWPDSLQVMVDHRRYGQKNGVGFYRYEVDPAGKPRKSPAPDSHELLKAVQASGIREFADAEIVERMMLPMINEAVRCLDEAVVETAAELDMALLLGLGLPQYLGGALKFADWLGLERVLEWSQRLGHLGPQWVTPPCVSDMAASGARFYGN